MGQATTVTDQLRRAIREVQRRRIPRRRRYDGELQRRVVEHVLAERSRGRSAHVIAAELGLSYQTVLTWLQGRSGGFRAVVAAKSSAPAPTPRSELRLILAAGHRVEGLSREDLIVLLRSLS